MGFWFYDSGISQLLFLLSSAGASLILFVFGLVGIIKAWNDRGTITKYLAWIVIITPLILFVTVVETRYRFQIYPLLAIFAGFTIMSLHEKKAWFTDKVLRIALVIVVINGIIDLSLSIDKLQEKLGLFF